MENKAFVMTHTTSGWIACMCFNRRLFMDYSNIPQFPPSFKYYATLTDPLII